MAFLFCSRSWARRTGGEIRVNHQANLRAQILRRYRLSGPLSSRFVPRWGHRNRGKAEPDQCIPLKLPIDYLQLGMYRRSSGCATNYAATVRVHDLHF